MSQRRVLRLRLPRSNPERGLGLVVRRQTETARVECTIIEGDQEKSWDHQRVLMHSLDWTPGLRTPTCHQCGPKMQKKTKNKKQKTKTVKKIMGTTKQKSAIDTLIQKSNSNTTLKVSKSQENGTREE